MKLQFKIQYLLMLIGFFCLNSHIVGQNRSKMMKEGIDEIKNGNFYNAKEIFENLYSADTVDPAITFHLGEIYYNFNHEKKAYGYYLKCYKKDKGENYPMAIFRMAEIQKKRNEFAEAKKNFRKAAGKVKKYGNYWYLKAKEEQIACDFGLKNSKIDSNEIQLKNLYHYNSLHAEFAPFLGSDSMFYFTGLRPEYDSVYYSASEKISGYTAKYHEEKSQEIKTIVLQPALKSVHLANICEGESIGKIYFTVCEIGKNCAVYKGILKDDTIKAYEVLPEKINEKGSNTTQPFFTKINTKEYLFFSSDRPGGSGQYDLYCIEKDNNNDWLIAKNLGKNINTPGNEISPYYDTLNKQFYFSSDFLAGFGGFDIFKAGGEPEKLSKPENMRIPINSNANDVYFSLSPDKKFGFFASNRLGPYNKEGSICCNDIFHFKRQKTREIPSLIPDSSMISSRMSSTMEKISSLIPLNLYFKNDEPDPRSKSDTTSQDYLECLSNYVLSKPEYISGYSSGLLGEQINDAKIEMESFFENYVEPADNKLNQLCKNILAILLEGESLELSIKAYTSALASDEYNLILSKRRIVSFTNYLKNFQAGVLIPYINGQKPNYLKVTQIPFGEENASQQIDDNIYDIKEGVYSIAAGLDRKIVIATIKLTENTTAEIPKKKSNNGNDLQMRGSNIDLGQVPYGKMVNMMVEIENTGSDIMKIKIDKPDCICLSVNYPPELKQGEKALVVIQFNTKGKLGKHDFNFKLTSLPSGIQIPFNFKCEVMMNDR